MMTSELREIFAQGDTELRATAGESAVLVRCRDGERIEMTVVISPAEFSYEIERPNGAILLCDRTALINADTPAHKPRLGDKLEASGQVFEVVKVAGWAYDTSWHVDLALRRK